MLFSEKYSDLLFAWGDGSRVNAHQFVVFSRSEYFETFGSWEKRQCNNEGGKVTIINIKEYSPEEIKNVLRYLYTDEVKIEFGCFEATTRLIEMSKLFQIPGLQAATVDLWLKNERYNKKAEDKVFSVEQYEDMFIGKN